MEFTSEFGYPFEPKTKNSVGYDLYSNVTMTILPGTQCTINTGIKILKFPSFEISETNFEKYYGKIEDRSSLASKGLKTCGGVIDPDYHDSIKVVLWNISQYNITVNKGERIAQLIFNRCYVESKTDTERTGGFGSTGA